MKKPPFRGALKITVTLFPKSHGFFTVLIIYHFSRFVNVFYNFSKDFHPFSPFADGFLSIFLFLYKVLQFVYLLCCKNADILSNASDKAVMLVA